MTNFLPRHLFGPWIGITVILISLQAPPGLAQAQQAHPATSNPPLQNLVEEFLLSEAVRSEDRGELQFTIGAEGLRHRGIDSSLDMEYGITDRLQFTMETPYGIQERPQSDALANWSRVSLGGLYQFIRSNYPFALAAAMAMGVPVNGRGVRGYQPELLVAKAIGPAQVHFSFIADVTKNQGNSWEYNAAWVRPIPHGWIATFEVNGRRTDGSSGLYFTPGIYRHFHPGIARRVEVGAGTPSGIGPAASHFGLAAKITVEFGGKDD